MQQHEVNVFVVIFVCFGRFCYTLPLVLCRATLAASCMRPPPRRSHVLVIRPNNRGCHRCCDANTAHRYDRLEVAHVPAETLASDAPTEHPAVVVEVADASVACRAVVSVQARGTPHQASRAEASLFAVDITRPQRQRLSRQQQLADLIAFPNRK